MATAVSGSGPAYVFLTMEAMIDAAVHVGFPRDIAVKLVTATIRGSATYAQQSGDSIPTLRNQVTSPGTHSFHYNLILDIYVSLILSITVTYSIPTLLTYYRIMTITISPIPNAHSIPTLCNLIHSLPPPPFPLIYRRHYGQRSI